MPLYDQFNDEAEFREKFVKPLLNRLGFYGVSEQHGSQEFGKDFVFSELHRLGGMRHHAAQVKHEKSIKQGNSVDDLLSQVKQAFARPFTRTDSPRECHVSSVYIINSGDITANAKEQLLASLQHEHYGDNVHFLDGERLEALNEWATLQNDANARTRLLGLRSALRFIIKRLQEVDVEAKIALQPIFIQGIELYLSEPVNCDDELLQWLFALWEGLQSIETARKIGGRNRSDTVREQVAPTIIAIAQGALPLAIRICQRVDDAIEKLKPIGGS
jgi:hypothetical protein